MCTFKGYLDSKYVGGLDVRQSIRVKSIDPNLMKCFS